MEGSVKSWTIGYRNLGGYVRIFLEVKQKNHNLSHNLTMTFVTSTENHKGRDMGCECVLPWVLG
jgi:hypothetical protein